MKTKRVQVGTKEQPIYEDQFIANDGTVFGDEQACKDYDFERGLKRENIASVRSRYCEYYRWFYLATQEQGDMLCSLLTDRHWCNLDACIMVNEPNWYGVIIRNGGSDHADWVQSESLGKLESDYNKLLAAIAQTE